MTRCLKNPYYCGKKLSTASSHLVARNYEPRQRVCYRIFWLLMCQDWSGNQRGFSSWKNMNLLKLKKWLLLTGLAFEHIATFFFVFGISYCWITQRRIYFEKASRWWKQAQDVCFHSNHVNEFTEITALQVCILKFVRRLNNLGVSVFAT